LEQPIDTTSALYPQSVALLKAMLHMDPYASMDTPLPREIRLAGVSASMLCHAQKIIVQPSLEDLIEESTSSTGETKSSRLRNAEQALDAVRKRYGKNSARLGLDNDMWKGVDAEVHTHVES
jgi:DNA polymerase-4